MARWDPGAQDRLRRAAVDLFLERGYDDVTVAEIAERAELTRRSFFRYFADKREVLFAGSEQFPQALTQTLASIGETGSPFTDALRALSVVGSQLVDYIDNPARRRTIIQSSPELRERERTKLADIATAIREALVQRNVDAPTARMVAQVSTVIFRNAFDAWIDAAGARDFESCLTATTAQLRSAIAAKID